MLVRMILITILTAIPLHKTVAAQASLVDEESHDYYQKWLEEHVLYIITPEEKDVFLSLTTNEEREQFIEQFWRRRDSVPETKFNEFKEEHYRRIAYANDKFTSGIDGWRTDRGMVYIKFGPPTEIASYPTGGTYQRKPWEGGGITETFPFEVWRYRYIEGIGEVEIEFVDPSMSGEYHIALSPDEKDALLTMPNAGLTLAEKLGRESKAIRIGDPFRMNQTREYGLTPHRFQDLPFEKILRHYKLEKPPEIKYRDLQEQVDARVSYDAFPVTVRSEHLRLSSSLTLVPVSIQVRSTDLQYGETKKADVDIYGKVTTLSRRTVYEFAETLTAISESNHPNLVYQRHLPLEPGRYKLSLVVRDVNSGRIGTTEVSLIAPNYPPKNLQISSLILAHGVSFADSGSSLESVAGGRLKLLQNPDLQFNSNTVIGVYAEVYGMTIDQSTQNPEITIDFQLESDKYGNISIPIENIEGVDGVMGDGVLFVAKRALLKGLSPGRYVLRIQACDQIAGNQVDRSAHFWIVE